MTNTLKIFNNFQNSALEIVISNNFEFKVLYNKSYSDDNFNHYFCSQPNGEFYRISANPSQNIRDFRSFEDKHTIIPNSAHPIHFDLRATGIHVGKRFWLVGGSTSITSNIIGTLTNIVFYQFLL